jgi:hypothetical protein
MMFLTVTPWYVNSSTGNAMACVELNHLTEMLAHILSNKELIDETSLIDQDLEGLLLHCKRIVTGICMALDVELKKAEKTSQILPYEIDGFDGQIFMDDANIPSLLSLPTIGYLSSNHDVYKHTRTRILSPANPYYFEGSQGQGIGGPHEGINYAWPMAIITQALTSQNETEIKMCLELIIRSSAGTGLLHESFNVNNVFDYTREWFAWVNGMFGELLLQLILTYPKLILIDDDNIISYAQSLVHPPVSLLSLQYTFVSDH